ncbi:hypothetical protein [Pseudoalteromonas peptidolytica]|uniref:hypothetical protein n=1 Tax=Pseudoalteromonas peptidolytica TaxID=61150 RepID=UPI00298EC5AD|nr:hypothetical protein [Pseudoalteromonas peptidolytica]MDW7551268.1 hypothetical protein [Pseudoalteromonas peptidolytica]
MTIHRKTITVPVKTGSRDHRHSNLDVLDSFRTDQYGTLKFNSKTLVDKEFLESSLRKRELLQRPYVVVSYSTHLSLTSGLPYLNLLTFKKGNEVNGQESHNCTIRPYDAVMHINQSNAELVTNSVNITSDSQPDGKAHQLLITTIPSYEDQIVKVSLDNTDSWYVVAQDTPIDIPNGASSLRAKLSMPQSKDPADTERPIYGIYILYR